MGFDYAQELGDYYQRYGKDEPGFPVKPVPMPITREEIYELADNQTDETKSLIFGLYLTGARVSELLEVGTNDFTDQIDESFNRQITVKIKTEKKRRGFPIRNLALRSNNQIEVNMLNHVLNHKYTFEKLGKKKLYEFSRVSAWRKLNKISFKTQTLVFDPKPSILDDQEQKLYPHYLRHCRATHLVMHYNFNPFALKEYMGWSSIAPAVVYVNLDWRTASNLLLSSREVPGAIERLAAKTDSSCSTTNQQPALGRE